MPHIRGEDPKPQSSEMQGKITPLPLPKLYHPAGEKLEFCCFFSSTTSGLMECLVSIVLLMPPKGFILSCIFLQEGSEQRDASQNFPAGCSRFNAMRRNSLQTHFPYLFPKEKYPLTLSRIL